VIDRDTRSIELATEHLGGDVHTEHITCELDVGLQIVDIGSAFKDLDDSTLAANFEDLTFSELTVAETDIDNFGIFGELNIVEDNERALYVEDGTVVDAGSDVVVTHSSFDVGN